MNKEEIKGIIKELFKNDEIEIEVESEESKLFSNINTTVKIYMDDELLSKKVY